MSFWTDDFGEFKQRVEPIFGEIEMLAKRAPDAYAHLVLSHGFIEYSVVRRLDTKIKERITAERGSCDIRNVDDSKLHDQYLKEEYLAWARANKLEEYLLEKGWQEYLND